MLYSEAGNISVDRVVKAKDNPESPQYNTEAGSWYEPPKFDITINKIEEKNPHQITENGDVIDIKNSDSEVHYGDLNFQGMSESPSGENADVAQQISDAPENNGAEGVDFESEEELKNRQDIAQSPPIVQEIIKPLPPKNEDEYKKIIDRWNWGAFLLTWIWGIFHGVWFSLFALIPVVNLILAFILGLNGNWWAWQSGKFASLEDFNAKQKKWKIAGVITWVVVLIAAPILFVTLAVNQIAAERFRTVRNAQRTSNSTRVLSAIDAYRADHQNNCPQNLSELTPKYIKSIEAAEGESYDYFIEGETCRISVELEGEANPEEHGDQLLGNGSRLDKISSGVEFSN